MIKNYWAPHIDSHSFHSCCLLVLSVALNALCPGRGLQRANCTSWKTDPSAQASHAFSHVSLSSLKALPSKAVIYAQQKRHQPILCKQRICFVPILTGMATRNSFPKIRKCWLVSNDITKHHLCTKYLCNGIAVSVSTYHLFDDIAVFEATTKYLKNEFKQANLWTSCTIGCSRHPYSENMKNFSLGAYHARLGAGTPSCTDM